MIVLDASAAVAALTSDGPARRRIRGEELVAPHLVDVEIVSTMRVLVRRQLLDADVATELLTAWSSLAVRRVSTASMLTRIWALRENVSPYAAAYVALAETWGLPLLTADRRLAGAPGVTCLVEVVSS